MTSIFSLRCPRCEGALEPQGGAIWACEKCQQTYEACGQVLVRVTPDDEHFGRHEPVDAEGSAYIGLGKAVTDPPSSVSSA